jgi:DNA-binding PadR family transcriptional regulator
MPVTLPRTRLSATEYALLGLLRSGERSGYDLGKEIRGSVGHFWAPAKSQIYAVLPRLVRDGYATVRELPQSDRPDKQLYRLTMKGRRVLSDWLADPDVEPDVSRNPILLKIFFAADLSADALVALLEERLRADRETLAEYEEIERRIAGDETEFYGYLTLKFGLARIRATIDWAEDAIAEVRTSVAA